MPETLVREWIDRVLAEHRELDRLIEDLRAFIAEPRPELGASGSHTWAAELSHKLVRLFDKLYVHFRDEERGGMIEDLMASHPRVAAAAESLLDDHKQMLRDLRRTTNAAMKYSEGRTPGDPALRKRLTTLLDALRRHEQVETELIQRLEYEEFGVGD